MCVFVRACMCLCDFVILCFFMHVCVRARLFCTFSCLFVVFVCFYVCVFICWRDFVVDVRGCSC